MVQEKGNKQNNQNPQFAELYRAILNLKSLKDCQAFFQDLCTPAEIVAMSDRFLVAKLLDQGNLSYRDIHEKTGVSLATIGRVARFLSQEDYQGYRLILDRMNGIETGLEKEIEKGVEK